MSQSTIDALPNELLEYTFDFLDDIKDKLSVRGVNQHWRTIGASPALWRRTWVDYRLALLLLKHAPAMLLRVDMTGREREWPAVMANAGVVSRGVKRQWTLLGKAATAVRYPLVEANNGPTMPVKELLSGEHLREMVSWCDNIWHTSSSLARVERAVMGANHDLGEPHMRAAFALRAIIHLPALRSLTLDGDLLMWLRFWYDMKPFPLIELNIAGAVVPPALEDGERRSFPELVRAFYAMLPSLKVLAAPRCTEVDLFGGVVDLPVVRALESLTISCAVPELAEGVAALNYPGLRSLTLHATPNTPLDVGGLFGNFLTRMPALETLRIIDTSGGTLQDFAALRVPAHIKTVVWESTTRHAVPRDGKDSLVTMHFLESLPFLPNGCTWAEYVTLPLPRPIRGATLVRRAAQWEGWAVHVNVEMLSASDTTAAIGTPGPGAEEGVQIDEACFVTRITMQR